MPPPRQYPGLGPLPEALGMSPSAPASEGTRAEGLALLSQMFQPPTLDEMKYRALREHYFGPMRRSVEEALGAPVPKRTVPERMQDQQAQMERDYYSVPSAGGRMQGPTGAQLEFEKGAAQHPTASGQAVPTPTDEKMAELMSNALTGLGVGVIGRGFRKAGEPLEEIITHMLRSRRTPESAATQMAGEESRRGGPTAESLAAEAGPGTKGSRYTIQQFNPPEGYPMPQYSPRLPSPPGYAVPELPFYFQ